MGLLPDLDRSTTQALEPEYRTLAVADDGTTRTDDWVLESEPLWPWGWEVDLWVEPCAGALVLGRLTVGGFWQGGGELVFDNWTLQRGGRVYVPWPRARFSFIDGLGPAGANTSTVRGWAKRRQPHEPVLGAIWLLGRSKNAGTKGSTTSTTIPTGVTEYKAVPEDGATADLRIVESWTPTGGAAIALGAYRLDPAAETPPGAEASDGWRVAPPATGAAIGVVNEDAGNDRPVWLYWRYDLLRACR